MNANGWRACSNGAITPRLSAGYKVILPYKPIINNPVAAYEQPLAKSQTPSASGICINT